MTEAELKNKIHWWKGNFQSAKSKKKLIIEDCGMMENIYFIHVGPIEDSVIIYVGRTIRPIDTRLLEHCIQARTLKTVKDKSINKIIMDDGDLRIHLYKVVSVESAPAVESCLIHNLSADGHTLLNGNRGGGKSNEPIKRMDNE